MDDKTKTENSSLPENIKKAIEVIDVDSTLASISKKYNLHVDQTGALATETYMVITGITDGAEFVDNVEKEVGIAEDVAVQIVTDINNQIFLKIRQLLQGEAGELETESISSGEREQTLDAIENPIPTKPTTSLTQVPERELINKTTTDNFIGKKMSPDVSSQNTEINPTRKKYADDPYREPVN